MKKSAFVLAAALLLSPVALAAQETSRKTWFEGEPITGVDAQDFDVVLVKSDRTRAVVKLPEGLERFLYIERNAEGIVSIDLKFMTEQEMREFSRLNRGDPSKKLTLYLPTVNTIRLQGRIHLVSDDSFPGDDLDIMLANNARIGGDLKMSSERVKVQVSGSSQVENLILDATTDLTFVGNSLARATIVAPRATYSKLNVSGGALRISGAGERGNWSAGGSARLIADEFAIKDLTADAYGSSSMVVNVLDSGALRVRTTGTASVRYLGTPRINHDSRSRASSVKPL
jgi:hypothetical protein